MDTKPETKLCSACGQKPRADQREKSTNTQCSDCKYEAQKRWTMNKSGQEQAQAFHRGVEAMAEHVAKAFDVYKARDSGGNLIQRFGGPEIADIVRRCERPKFTESALSGEAG